MAAIYHARQKFCRSPLFISSHLVPFVVGFGPVVGMKVASAIFAALAVLLMQITLKVYRVKYALWYTMMFLGSGGLFSFELRKTTALSLCVVFAIIFGRSASLGCCFWHGRMCGCMAVGRFYWC